MAVIQVYSHAIQQKYKASVCSKATFFQLCVFILTVVPPLIFAYKSQGFWLKLSSYVEQPDIRFKYQLLVILDTADDYLAWSTFQNFNSLQQSHIRIPLVKSREEDVNRDGKKDLLHFSLEMPVTDTEDIFALQLLLFFDYRLYKFSEFTMESMAYVHHSAMQSGAEYSTDGHLILVQRQPLAHRGVDSRYNNTSIDQESIFAEAYDFKRIFKEYNSRNVTTRYDADYSVWVRGRGSGMPFTITITVRYPEESVTYTPGFWQVMKDAWIQYLAVLIIFVLVFDRIKKYVFKNQLVTTIVDRRVKPHDT
ncbi:PREDICTED: transmembrane protein 231-like [Priapulus caudatus]|uniref:Transmembrane protein 231 n=1 Tax=Priapulus caudatus TaxID=37621 RepID=A0ABM1ERR2_PRICU|nr:PREDICTED: transmembrane protein 231-like [Priapulus caudatus]